VKGPETVGGSTCKAGWDKIELPPAAQLETLNKILPNIKYIPSGVGGKPTIQFTGVNVQVVSGAGKTNAAVNGEGNLVIGYDENTGAQRGGNPALQTGSHNLILGEEQEFTSYGGLLGGYVNSVTAAFASVTGGLDNVASGQRSSVTGGAFNTASNFEASVNGGATNTASEGGATVNGGEKNTASGFAATVNGGGENISSGFRTAVGGGGKNHASGEHASIFGGKELNATVPFEAIP
jgi:trimeric autotransporter adhesin